MAKIELFSKFDEERKYSNKMHGSVQSEAFLVEHNNELYLQIGTFGSPNRKNPKQVSQTTQIKYSDLVRLIDKIGRGDSLEYTCNGNRLILNRLVFGAPGTGKSYRLSEDIKKNNLSGNYERVTFHSNYTFSQFVGTYKPVSRIVNNEKKVFYEYIPGPFLRILVQAKKNPNSNYLLLIEEINRANPATVLGDVFQLLDRSSSGESKYEITISEDMKGYLKSEGLDIDVLRIPGNMYIWATMNSADQGVYHMDSAFKRRWTPEYIGIDENSQGIEQIKILLNGVEYYWNNVRMAFNKNLLENGINEDKLIGPYFFSFEELNTSGEEFENVFINKLLVYIYEDILRNRKIKFFDDKVKSISDIRKFYKENKLFMFEIEPIDDDNIDISHKE